MLHLSRMPSFGNVWSRIRHEAVAIRHTDERKCALVDDLPFADDLVEVQKVCGQCIDLLRGQRAGILVRHRTVDVVPHCCGIWPIASDRENRVRTLERILTAGERGIGIITLAAQAMAARADRFIERPTVARRRPPVGKPRPSGPTEIPAAAISASVAGRPEVIARRIGSRRIGARQSPRGSYGQT